MVLFSFHYLITSIYVTAWVGRPWSLLVVPALFYLTQVIVWTTSAPAVGVDGLVWGWQLLVTFLGLLTGIKFLYLARVRRVLAFRVGYERMWLIFFLSTAALVGAQVLYATLPPTPLSASVYGIFFCALATVAVVGATWYAMLGEDEWLRRDRMELPFLFFPWLGGLMVAAQLMFYLAFTGLAEVWVALLAAAPGLALMWTLSWCCWCFV